MQSIPNEDWKSAAQVVALVYGLDPILKEPLNPEHLHCWHITIDLWKSLKRNFPNIKLGLVHRVVLDFFEGTPFEAELKSRLSFPNKSHRSPINNQKGDIQWKQPS